VMSMSACLFVRERISEITRPIFIMMARLRQPSHQASRLGLRVRRKLAATIHIHHRHCYYYSARSPYYSFYRPTKGGRLSRPKHCSKGAQPVLKTVYHSSRRDKHNCLRRDSNLDPLTPDALTTRLLRPAKVCCLRMYRP